ncbi:hypothetical protein PT974_07932 [Cladobotryum mycophilum]|uniref:Uncharacterized protein n=1 Tax=Cladobotryum mycophilum TaxID=491253 RepID=A0ABR0SBX5_9HYPO
MPGDTRLDRKWQPSMLEDDDDMMEWQKVVIQVLNYMIEHGTRYGFVITDANLVVLRLARATIHGGLARDRPRRNIAAGPGHQSQPSDASMASTNDSSSSYGDGDPTRWHFHDPEYAVIPWGSHGTGVLTIKLAFWCLSLMATNRDRWIDYSYPQLHSWRRAENGFVHNTSGATKASLSPEDVYKEPNP